MNARPLELASRLRPPPRGFEALFYVNLLLLVQFFALFGAPFVLLPGMAIEDLPQLDASAIDYQRASAVITLDPSGQIFNSSGPISVQQLGEWLKAKALEAPAVRAPGAASQPTLLIMGVATKSMQSLGPIVGAARTAGYQAVLAAEPVSPK